MPQEPDQVIAGKYRLIRPLARGGMGSVWLAHHIELEVAVAVKFCSATQLDNKMELRFKREAQAAAQLKSPHVVHVYDFGLDEACPYIAMELLEGEDLDDHLAKNTTLSPERALELIKQLAKALSRAHELGIVHRDIKPSNLFLVRQGSEEILKVLDFGIAKASRENDQLTTSTGLILGSPAYMSPEQARGLNVDHKSDLWSVSALLYRMLTGSQPFVGESPQDVIVKICTEPAPKVSRLSAHLPAELDAFFERALARDRSRRFQTIDELVRAFEAAIRDAPKLESATVSSSPRAGRTTDTEPLTSPIVVPGAQTPRSRWQLPAALAVLGTAIVVWASTRKPGPREAESVRASFETAQVAASAAPAPSSREHLEALKTLPTTAPSATALTSSVTSARKTKRSSEKPQVNSKPAAPPARDPVFGIPLPATSEPRE